MPVGFDRQNGDIDQVRLSVCMARSSSIAVLGEGVSRVLYGHDRREIMMSREEFERMRARHRTEIEQALAELRRKRSEFERKFAELRAEMAAAQIEFERALTEGARFEAARAYRDKFNGWPDMLRKKGRRRPPRRGFGGEPAPVLPRPKPTPLTHGAEAPVE